MKFYAIAVGELKPDFVSRMIQDYLTEEHGVPVNWSHCGVEVEGSLDSDGVWDATGRGFEHCSMDECLGFGKAVVRHRIELKVRNPDRALGWLYGNRGRWYARAQYILYFMPGWLRAFCGKVLPSPVKKLFANGRALQVCSEAVDYFMVDNVDGAEAVLRKHGDGDTTDPLELVNAAYEVARLGR